VTDIKDPRYAFKGFERRFLIKITWIVCLGSN